MTENELQLLSAFFDGESVDPAALAEALDDTEAIGALRGFARLRADVASAHPTPRPGWIHTTRAKLVELDGGSWWGRWVPVPVPAMAAAAVVVAALGIWGWRAAQAPIASPKDHPPEATRTIAFELGKDWHQDSGTH